MKKTLFCSLIIISIVAVSCTARAGNEEGNPNGNVKKVLYFAPEVYPDLDEIKEPTNTAFFSAVSDRVSHMNNSKMIRVENAMVFDSIDTATLQDYCKNNDADFAVVPKVKYFKIGLGKYVFSNQVVVSMKLYDANGNFISESNYDTYRRNVRLLGSAENSIKIGVRGAIKDIIKEIRKSGTAVEGL